MSYSSDRSPHDIDMANRHKVNNIAFTSFSSPPLARCTICLEQWRLDVKDSPTGKVGICNRGCGATFNLTKINEEEYGGTKYATGQKYTNKFGSASGSQKSFAISQKKRGKRDSSPAKYDSVNSQLSEEDREDIHAAGGQI